jgi:hypothetical protein
MINLAPVLFENMTVTFIDIRYQVQLRRSQLQFKKIEQC